VSLDDALAGIWERGSPAMRDRLAAIGRAAEGPLDDEAHAAAVRAAHQLAGSLGTFGIEGGSEAAAELEDELRGARDPARVRALVDRVEAILRPRL
jgi:HPt (histidine-containing phosphotransfer) domain-containing protein